MKTSVQALFVVLLCQFLLGTVHGDSFTMSGLVRDFWPCSSSRWSDCGRRTDDTGVTCVTCHPDFERYIGDDRGIVKTNIRLPARVPAYNNSASHPSITSEARFDEWYKNVAGLNYPITVNVTLSNSNPDKPTLFIFEDTTFWPINRRGFGDWDYSRNLNFHFTYELHSMFTYRGREEFEYTGDDDLWVFINNKLVIDIGGVHGQQTAKVKLDNLGLTVNTIYPIDIFFAERHTSESNFKVYTTIAIFCPWKDHCGVCQGDGQSCCTCTDNLKCTVDTCEVTTGACVFTPITCTPSDKCKESVCNPSTGTCQETTKNCEDGDLCTNNGCNPASGCTSTAVPCNDNNACTSDTCISTSGCQYTNTSSTCEDGSVCTIDWCDRTNGCQRSTLNCDDNDACTDDSCHPQNGCQYTTVDCDDNNACTTDSCHPVFGCQHSAVVCNDNNFCTNDTCNIATGCVYSNITCQDSSLCTRDFCNPSSGCVFETVRCNDGDPCTNDTCIPDQGCKYEVIDCNRCLINGTNETKQCVYESECAPYYCTPDDGECHLFAVECDDNNACTDDSCQVIGGVATCVFTLRPCNNSRPCHPETCDPLTGICSGEDFVCNDNNPCTSEVCDDSSGNATCVFTDLELTQCDNSNKCLPQTCSRSSPTFNCRISQVNCDDNNPCTADSCDPATGLCSHVLNNCSDVSTPCHPLTCNPVDGTCTIGGPVICDDSNNCTTDNCVATSGECSFVDINCDDNDACTINSCDAALGCQVVNLNCDDNDKCTVDSCHPVDGCVNDPIDINAPGVIPDRDGCTNYICDALLGIVSSPVECRPADKCKCVPGQGCVCDNGILGAITAEQAALGAGALAAIIIGAAAFAIFIAVGSKKGYDYFKQKDLMTGAVMSSALYEPSRSNIDNPLYEGNEDLEK